MNLRPLLFILAGTVFIGAVYLFCGFDMKAQEAPAVLYLPGKEISLIVADNPQSRGRGLSGMKSLPENSAMLFVFDEADKYGIWMKDMNFPIDIIWLDANSRIVSIEKNISPDTFPNVFTPSEKSLYVIEAQAGFAEENALLKGKALVFSQKTL